jgi:hypothetical protein
MSLKNKITGDITAAMRAKDADRLSVLRMAKAALMNEANKKSADYELSDDESARVLQSSPLSAKIQSSNLKKPDAMKWRRKKKPNSTFYRNICRKPRQKKKSSSRRRRNPGNRRKFNERNGRGYESRPSQARRKSADGKLVSETVKAKLSQ